MRASAFALAMLAMAGPAAAETIRLCAAGSLKDALTDVAKAYAASAQRLPGLTKKRAA